MALTKKAAEGLQKLVAFNGQFPTVTYGGITYIATGLNTTVVDSLVKHGYISVDRLYLGGKVLGLKILKTEV